MNAYVPILILLAVALAVAASILVLTRLATRLLVRPGKSHAKQSVYESGVNPSGDARLRFSIKFYLVAMIFIIFDVEVVFFYPWAIVFRDMLTESSLVFWEMVAFVGVLLMGYVYVWRKGGLEWD